MRFQDKIDGCGFTATNVSPVVLSLSPKFWGTKIQELDVFSASQQRILF